MSTFTKGPWRIYTPIGRLGATYAAIYDSMDRWIGNAHGAHDGDGFPSDEEGMAIAHLIAAAPDMYEALVKEAEFQKANYGDDQVANYIEAALDKARGETE